MNLDNLADLLPQSKFELISDATAIAATASPLWLPPLKATSEFSALLLPIFGVVWLAVQIGFKFYSHFKNKHKS